LDLKWFTITVKRANFEPRTGSKACASGSRALSKAGASSITEGPTGFTFAAR
jgi:hypothetical protein